MPTAGDSSPPGPQSASARRLRRPERREQILDAATRAFSRGGYASTGLDAIAQEAGITRVLLYRHFDSKGDLYRAVLDRACDGLGAAVGSSPFGAHSIPALLGAAADDPDGFRLLFRYAAREEEFREQMDRFSADARAVAAQHLADLVPEPEWAEWAARVVSTLAIEAVLAWLDVGQPDIGIASERIDEAIKGVLRAVGPA